MTVETTSPPRAANRNPFAPPSASLDVEPAGEEQAYFAVGVAKLCVMSITTLGLYELYWFYKQWKCAARISGEKLWAPVRALFFPFTAYFLFTRMHDHAHRYSVSFPAVGALAFAVFFLNVAWRLPDPWWLVSEFAFLPLIAVQNAVNALNAKAAPGADENRRLTPGNVVAILLGGAITALAVIGVFMPGTAGE